MVLDNAEIMEKSQFNYMILYQHRIMKEIKDYSLAVRKPEYINISGRELEELIEDQSSALHNVISEAEIAYLKHGIKLGTQLMLELMH